jgi:hypothetical protein
LSTTKTLAFFILVLADYPNATDVIRQPFILMEDQGGEAWEVYACK